MRYLILALTLLTSFAATPMLTVQVDTNGLVVAPVGMVQTNNTLVATNKLDGKVTSEGSLVSRNLSDRFAEVVNVKDHGAVDDNSTDNTTAIQAAFDEALAKGKGVIFRGTNVFRTGPITINGFVDVDFGNSKVQAVANMTGHLFNITNQLGGNLEWKGGILDGNKANQTTNRWYALVHIRNLSTNRQTFRFIGTTFTNYNHAGIYGSSFHGDFLADNCVFVDGAEHGGTAGLVSSGISIISYTANSTNTVEVASSIFRQSSLPSDFGTGDSSAPGGIIITGGQTNNNANAWFHVNIHDSIFDKVGQDKAGNHIGAVDLYSGIRSATVQYNKFFDCIYIPAKLQNSGFVDFSHNTLRSEIGDDGHSAESFVVWVDPNERTDTDRHSRFANVSFNQIDGYVNKPAIYIVGVNADGFEGRAIGNVITNCASGIQFANWQGPISIANNHIWVKDGIGPGIQVSTATDIVKIIANNVVTTNITGVSLGGTNASYFLADNYFEADGSGVSAFTARGVKSITVSSGRYNGLNGATAASLMADSGGNNIQSVYWDFGANTFVNGSLSYTPTAINTWRGSVDGNATPEGLISATSPTLFRRLDSGGARLYIKYSGTTNTGWRQIPVNQVVATSTSYQVLDSDLFIRADSSVGAITITNLASPTLGAELEVFKNTSDGNIITISGNGKTMNGSASLTLTNQYDGYRMRFNGQEWRIVGHEGHTHPASEITDGGFNIAGNYTFQIGGVEYLSLSSSGLTIPYATANTVPYLNSSKILVSSTVTPTELGYLSGARSNLQTQIDNIGGVSDVIFGISWNGVTNVAPSKNVVYDEIINRQPLDSDLNTIANNNPGNSYYFGTDGTGVKGFYTFPGANAITNHTTIAVGDLTTALTVGAGKAYWRAPAALTMKYVRASLLTASSGGDVTLDVNEAGTTIFSTRPTIDVSETSTTTAAVPSVLSDTAIADDALITIDIDVSGTNAAGLQVRFYYTVP